MQRFIRKSEKLYGDKGIHMENHVYFLAFYFASKWHVILYMFTMYNWQSPCQLIDTLVRHLAKNMTVY